MRSDDLRLQTSFLSLAHGNLELQVRTRTGDALFRFSQEVDGRAVLTVRSQLWRLQLSKRALLSVSPSRDATTTSALASLKVWVLALREFGNRLQRLRLQAKE